MAEHPIVRPWLAAAILTKFSRQIAGATRVAQKHIVRSHGNGQFGDLFALSDRLVVEMRETIRVLEDSARPDCARQDTSHTPEDGVTECDPVPQYPDSSDHYMRVEELLQDRLKCIEPVLRAQLKSSLNMPTQVPRHHEVLRRNVAAHPRSNGNDLISSMDVGSLKRAQRGHRSTKLAASLHMDEHATSGTSIHCGDSAALPHVFDLHPPGFSMHHIGEVDACTQASTTVSNAFSQTDACTSAGKSYDGTHAAKICGDSGALPLEMSLAFKGIQEDIARLATDFHGIALRVDSALQDLPITRDGCLPPGHCKESASPASLMVAEGNKCQPVFRAGNGSTPLATTSQGSGLPPGVPENGDEDANTLLAVVPSASNQEPLPSARIEPILRDHLEHNFKPRDSRKATKPRPTVYWADIPEDNQAVGCLTAPATDADTVAANMHAEHKHADDSGTTVTDYEVASNVEANLDVKAGTGRHGEGTVCRKSTGSQNESFSELATKHCELKESLTGSGHRHDVQLASRGSDSSCEGAVKTHVIGSSDLISSQEQADRDTIEPKALRDARELIECRACLKEVSLFEVVRGLQDHMFKSSPFSKIAIDLHQKLSDRFL